MSGDKLTLLLETLRGLGSALVAYSGGTDSTFLLKAVRLSGIRALAVTARSEALPAHDLKDALAFSKEIGVPHRVVETAELNDESYLGNPPERCFHCKDILFSALKDIARLEGLRHIIDGTNADDASDYRPGIGAARMHGARSPLQEAGFRKAEIREASKALGLPAWDKPSSPCLSSRIPYGMRITKEALSMIDRAEDALRAMGFGELRVRHHGDTARIEIPEEMFEKLLSPDIRKRLFEELRAAGYKFVSLDLEGLRSGKMNRALP